MGLRNSEPYFGMKGAWLTFWVTVACATDMTLFGYDQGVFGSYSPRTIAMLYSFWIRWCNSNPRLSRPTWPQQQPLATLHRHCHLRHRMLFRSHFCNRNWRAAGPEEMRSTRIYNYECRSHTPDRFFRRTTDDSGTVCFHDEYLLVVLTSEIESLQALAMVSTPPLLQFGRVKRPRQVGEAN